MEVKLLNSWECSTCKADNINFSTKCSKCKQPRPSRGLGDTIHNITTALHIPHCGGCEQRRDALNQLVPYRKS